MSWHPHLSETPRWTCDCGKENARYRHKCIECGLNVTDRAVEQGAGR